MQRVLTALGVFLALLVMLQWGVPSLGVSPYILPTPTRVLARMADPETRLLHHFGVTAVEGIGGFLGGSLLGFVLAVVFVHARPIEDALYPWAIVSQTIPLVALAPLLLIWFGNGMLPRMAMSALFTFFPVLVNATHGMRQANDETLDLLHSYAISRWQLFWTLRLPNGLPALFTGLKIGSTLAITGAIVGEFAGAARGLGYLITVSTYHLETDQTFAAVTAASLLGVGLYALLVRLEGWMVFWQERV
ncbi:MAG: ABC transporter permease [Chloroflexaceae bacterium]|nr:ABC transporter permease [Chloroflexaceae bacterium]